MSLLDYQDALARLLTDRSFRTAFVSSPTDACRRYALDGRELASLTKIHTAAMLQHANLLGQARVMLALKALPHAARLLGDEVVRTVGPFCAAYPPVPVASSMLVVEARRYAAFLRSNAAEFGPAWVGEVAAYEAALYEHSSNPDAWTAANAFALENAAISSASARTFASSAPVTGKHSRIETFVYDAPAIVDALGRGEPIEEHLYAHPVIALLIKVTARRTCEGLRITRDVGTLLAQCDGSASGSDIVNRMSVEARRRGFPDDGLLDRVFTLCESLRCKNVLTYRAPTRPRTEHDV